MAGSKLLVGALLISGSSPLGSGAPVVSKSRETLVSESQKRFSRQQDKKRRRNRKLKRKLGIGVEFDLRKSKGKEGGFFDKEISSSGFGGVISGTSQNLSSIEDREPTKASTYPIEEQKKNRDKVFKQIAEEIIEEYKRPENVWGSPDKKLDESKLVNDAVVLLINQNFTDSEKADVKNRLREYGCSSSGGSEASQWRRPRILHATIPWWDLFSLALFNRKAHFYYGWLDYCNGNQSRYPNGSDRSFPQVNSGHRGVTIV